MAIESKEMIQHIRRVLVYSIRTGCKSARDHPVVSGVLFFLLLLYRCFPSLFAFLVSSSPVIACTALLLGLLLSFGEPNLPDVKEDNRTLEISSSLRVGSAANDLVVKKDETFAAEAHVESRTTHDDDEDDTSVAATSSVEEDDTEIHEEEEVTEVVQQVHDRGFVVDKRESSIEELSKGALEVGEDVCGASTEDQTGIEGLKVEIDKPILEDRFDSSLGSPWHPINIHDASSGSDSDRAESSSPDASMADIIPMLDELHPLLDSEPPRPALRSDDGSADEEAEHREEEEDEEAQEEKDDAFKEAVKWTADDQKNVMDLGISDIERNRRLENLIAKRRARKNPRLETEKDLIDLDSNVSAPSMEELSRFHFRIPPISATRRNPFDLLFDSEETMGLPPMPGSAPSILLHRGNPFDLPYNQEGHSGSLTAESLSHEDFVSVPQGGIFFQSHKSFSLGASSSGELKQEKHDSRLKPYFVAERAEETAFATLQREFSEKSDSKVSSVPEFDMASLVADQEHHKTLLREGELLSPVNFETEPVEQESQYTGEIQSVYVDHEQSGISVSDDRAIDLSTSMVTEEAHQAADPLGAVEEEIGVVKFDPPISEAAKLEAIEDKYDASTTTPLSEADEQSSKMGTHELSVSLDPTQGVSVESSDDSIFSLIVDSNLPRMAGESVGDSQIADPVYDLSPSASNMSTLDEALFDEGKGALNSSSSLISDMQADVSEVGSPPKPLVMPSSEATPIVHPSSLSFVETESCGDSPVDVEASLQFEGDKMIDAAISCSDNSVLSDHLTSYASEKAYQSMEKSVIQPSEGGLEESQVTTSNLPPIPEENLEDFKLEEEHESMIEPVGIVGLTDLPIKEPDVGLTDIEQELPFFQGKSTEETQNIDNTDRLVCEPENDDASVVSPIISSHDSVLSGVHLLEPVESMESSYLFDTKHELEINSPRDSSDSQGHIINEVQSEREGGFPKMLNNSDGESNKVCAEVRAIEEMDEHLLSELDAVGDFRAEVLKLDEEGPDMELQSDGQFVEDGADPLICPEKQDFPTHLQISEAGSVEDAGLSTEANLNDSDVLQSVVNQPEVRESEAGSSLGTSGVDPEMTVYNPKLHVLEACSFEELDSAFMKFCEEAVMQSGSEPFVEKSATAKTEAGSSEWDNADRDPKLRETDSELQVLEAKSIEDIHSAFEQLSKGGLDDSIFPEVEPSESLAGQVHLEPMGTHSDLEVVEAKSIEDIYMALKQLTDGTAENPLKPMEPKDGSAVFEASERHLEPEVLEVQSAEEIQLAFAEAVARETGSSHGQSDEKSHGFGTIANVSSTGASTSGTIGEER